MSGQVTTPGHIRIVLPGAWAAVPLVDPEGTRKFAQRLVRERVGRDDRLAKVRREATEQLCATADKARAAMAHTLAIALEIVPGVPFAASMVGRDVAWPAGPEGEADDDEVPDDGAHADDAVPDGLPLDPVAARLTSAYPDGELVELPSGFAVRTQEAGVLHGGEESTPSVSVLYRIPRPDADAVLTLRFTGPDLGRPELIATLFDAVAGSVEFTRERLFAGGATA